MKTIVLTGQMLGGATATLTQVDTGVRYTGYVEKVVYDWVDGASTSNLVLTANNNGIDEPILTQADIGAADAVWYPRTPANTVAAGAAFTNWADKIFVNSGTFQASVFEGAVTATLKFIVVLSDE